MVYGENRFAPIDPGSLSDARKQVGASASLVPQSGSQDKARKLQIYERVFARGGICRDRSIECVNAAQKRGGNIILSTCD